MKQIVCMKWGTMYGADYVNCLYGMISRNISYPFKLFCMTDNSTGIRAEVECLPLQELGFEVPPGAPGKWPKQALWSKELFGLDVVLFLDLDSVIVGNIDGYFEYGDPDDVITAKNWVKPWQNGAQTSVFRFKVGSHPYILEDLVADPQLCVKYKFEQNYLTHHLHGGVRFWPQSWTKHFRRNCMGIWPMRYLRPPRIPKNCKIITFPGSPKPHNAIIGHWKKGAPSLSPKQHLAWALSRPTIRERKKALHRFIQPCQWVAQHWHP